MYHQCVLLLSSECDPYYWLLRCAVSKISLYDVYWCVDAVSAAADRKDAGALIKSRLVISVRLLFNITPASLNRSLCYLQRVWIFLLSAGIFFLFPWSACIYELSTNRLNGLLSSFNIAAPLASFPHHFTILQIVITTVWVKKNPPPLRFSDIFCQTYSSIDRNV